MTEFPGLEGEVISAVRAGTDAPEPLGRLIAALLSELAGLAPRATDGLTPLREEAAQTGYFATAQMFMIEDQRAEPVWLELAFDALPRVRSGKILFGIAEGSASSTDRQKRLDALLAYPHEAVRSVPWAYEFLRTDLGWSCTRR